MTLWRAAFERILKGTLGVAVVVCPRLPEPAGGLTLISWSIFINLMHLHFLWRWKTCSVRWVTKMRGALLMLILWGQLVALMTVAVGGPAWFLLLVIVGSLLIAAMLGYCVYKVYYGPINLEDETPAVRAARLQRIQNDLLKRGANKATRTSAASERRKSERERRSSVDLAAPGENVRLSAFVETPTI